LTIAHEKTLALLENYQLLRESEGACDIPFGNREDELLAKLKKSRLIGFLRGADGILFLQTIIIG